MKKLLCYLGLHDWRYASNTIAKCDRNCERCDKWQHSAYDMTNGETMWRDGKYWQTPKQD